jgi:hypothetical protein
MTDLNVACYRTSTTARSMELVATRSLVCLGISVRLNWYGTLLLIPSRARTRVRYNATILGYLQKSALVLLGLLYSFHVSPAK